MGLKLSSTAGAEERNPSIRTSGLKVLEVAKNIRVKRIPITQIASGEHHSQM